MSAWYGRSTRKVRSKARQAAQTEASEIREWNFEPARISESMKSDVWHRFGCPFNR